MTEWQLSYSGYDPETEPLREALCTVGNGYIATRGAAPESSAGGPHYPGTYLAGLYNRMTTEVAGRDIENEDLVNAPNWLPLRFRIAGGEWFEADNATLVDYHQELDMRRGILTRIVEFEDDTGRRTGVTQRRFAHMRTPHMAGLQTTVAPKNWSGTIEVESLIDGGVTNDGVARYRAFDGRHLRDVKRLVESPELVGLTATAKQSRIVVAVAARTTVLRNGANVEPKSIETMKTVHTVGTRLEIDVSEDLPVTIDKVVAIFTSRDRAISSPELDALNTVEREGTFDELLESHVLAWDQLWRRFHLRIGAGEDEARALNLHIFHLLQTVSKHSIDLDVGVPARGLHGEAYRGHIFWDEVFIFPFLNLHLPDLTKALLMYRYRRLPEARANAAADGLAGALFPWQSGTNGREESQILHLNPKSGNWLPDNSRLQRHVNIAIAYNVWHYYSVTDDLSFMTFHGAELLVEISRMLVSLTTYNRSLDRYEIKGVMGPDEYHDGYPDRDEPGLDNNTYTNVMAVWVLQKTRAALDALPEFRRLELWDKLGLSREELEKWEDVTRKMLVVFHEGVLSQFEGYGDLNELDWEDFRARYGNIQRLDRILEAEDDDPNRYKLSKQPDVLMLFYLLSYGDLSKLLDDLGYDVHGELVQRTIAYYQRRTSHGSTLSRVVMAWILARTDRKQSWSVFRAALMSDLSDIQGGTTKEGIHLGAMAGTVDLVQRGYTGLQISEGHLRFDPAIPVELGTLECHILYRGNWLDLIIGQDELSVTLEPGSSESVEFRLGTEAFEVTPGATVVVPLV